MSQKHLDLIEKPHQPNFEGALNYYKGVAEENAKLADKYRLQSLIYLGEIQRANKALQKRSYQIHNLKDRLSKHPKA